MRNKIIIALFILLSAANFVSAERIKDIVDIEGIRSNPLTGIGLVVGLAGTGDSSLPSQQMLTNLLRNTGNVFETSDIKGGNIAIVTVTGQLGAFNKVGSRIDVDVSSIGDAKSLDGGILMPTPLLGFDGEVYAVTEAKAVSIAGWTVSGEKASITKNHQTVGRIPSGAIVEKEEVADFVHLIGNTRYIKLYLRNNDFSTAQRICEAINRLYPNQAVVMDAGTIKVAIPSEIDDGNIAGFIDQIRSPEVKTDFPAVVVINEKTGTIVVGENVGISAVAISQGSLVVKIKETPIISQPTAPFSDSGETRVVNDTSLSAEEQTLTAAEEDGTLIPMRQSITVAELANTLNSIGASPSDLIAIFNALKQAGALQARLEMM